jgi:hypothetical protein
MDVGVEPGVDPMLDVGWGHVVPAPSAPHATVVAIKTIVATTTRPRP